MEGFSAPRLLLPLLAAITSLVLLFYALPRRHPPGIQMMPWVSVAALLWAVSDLSAIAITQAPQNPELSNWLRAIGMDILPLASLLQVLLLTGKINWPNRGSLVVFSAALLVEQGLYWVFDSQSSAALASQSVAYALHLTLRLIPLLVAGILLAYQLIQAPRLLQRTSWLFMFVSLLIGIIYITEYIEQPASSPPHLSPLFADLSQAAFLFATLRFQLHIILPLTRTALMDRLAEAVFVLDVAGDVVDLNPAARRVLESLPNAPHRGKIKRQPVGRLFPELSRFFESPNQTIPSRLELDIGAAPVVQVMELSISPLAGAGFRPSGWLLLMRDISRLKKEQIRQQESIRLWESQARLLNATLSATPDFIFIIERQGNFLYASPTPFEFFERGSKTIEELGWSDMRLPEPILQTFARHLEEIFDTREARSFEFQVPAEGGLRYFNVYLSPFDASDANQPCAACTIREITSRRLMEEALKESERRYRTIVEVLDEGIVIHDHMGRVTGCNRSAQRLLGLTVDYALGKIFVDTQQLSIREDGSPFPHEHHPAMRALNTGQPQEKVVMGMQSPNQEMRWLLVTSQPLIQEGQSAPYAVVSSYVDITRNKLAENELRASQQRFETLLEFAPAVMLVVDSDLRIRLVNSRLEADLGYRREQLLGQPVSVLIPERFHQAHAAHQEKFMLNPVARRMSTELSLVALKADGSELSVDIGLSPIETNEG